MEMRTISRLTWDPEELYWKVWIQDQIKDASCFQYSVTIGRKILGGRSWKEQTANYFWRCIGLSPQHLMQFWKCLWSIKMSRKIVCFRWLLVHRAIPVNGWRKGNANNICPFVWIQKTLLNIVWGVIFVGCWFIELYQLMVCEKGIYTICALFVRIQKRLVSIVRGVVRVIGQSE